MNFIGGLLIIAGFVALGVMYPPIGLVVAAVLLWLWKRG